ncbi:DnaJ domain-containing protein [Scheffersomyces amazonensis]|uniref:DnaJ domain-containing protein n=1 Tax=Scheffersomyces amazonensis TaxID=1078765 RepID=UPI00315C7CFE
MAVPFPDIDPYTILGVGKESSPLEIKKSYKKLCLKYHPDKLQQQYQQQQQDNVDGHLFAKIQFAYSILSDSSKRQRYDRTGSLEEFGDQEEGFDWQDYFNSINEKITIDMIEEDKIKYQNSEEEREDIISNFLYYEGDFLKLFELIPHLEFSESEEQRVFGIIQDEIESELDNNDLVVDKSTLLSWNKYKKSRKTKVKQMLKKLAKEAKEAEEIEKMIKDKSKRSIKNESDLGLLIKSRQANRLDNLINSLESKYLDKRGKKRSDRHIDEDEFDRIQKDLESKRKRK